MDSRVALSGTTSVTEGKLVPYHCIIEPFFLVLLDYSTNLFPFPGHTERLNLPSFLAFGLGPSTWVLFSEIWVGSDVCYLLA